MKKLNVNLMFVQAGLLAALAWTQGGQWPGLGLSKPAQPRNPAADSSSVPITNPVAAQEPAAKPGEEAKPQAEPQTSEPVQGALAPPPRKCAADKAGILELIRAAYGRGLDFNSIGEFQGTVGIFPMKATIVPKGRDSVVFNLNGSAEIPVTICKRKTGLVAKVTTSLAVIKDAAQRAQFKDNLKRGVLQPYYVLSLVAIRRQGQQSVLQLYGGSGDSVIAATAGLK